MDFFSDYLRYNTHGILSLASGILCLSLGGLILSQNPLSKINRAFFCFTLSAAMWIIGYSFVSLVKDPTDVYFWVKFAYIFGVPFIPVNSYILSSRIRGFTDNKIAIYIGYSLASISSVWIFFKTETIGEIVEYSWGRYSSWKPTIQSISHEIFLVVPFIIYAGLGFNNFYKAWKQSNSIQERLKTRNILIGFIIGYLGSLDFLTASQVNVYASGYLSLTLFVCVLSYAIIRHHAFNIKVAIKKVSLIFIIYIFLLLVSLPAAVPILNMLLRNLPFHQNAIVLIVGVFIGTVFSMGPIIYAFFIRNSYWLRGHTTTGLTHEMKSPLNAIQSAIEIMSEEVRLNSADKSKTITYIEMIKNNATRLEIFIQDLLNLAKIQDENLSIEKIPLNLSSLAVETIETYKSIADKKGVQIHASIQQGIDIEGDSAKIRQIISNILSNAIKFSESGEMKVDLTRTDTDILFSVSDHGPGIEKKDLRKIFDRFYQIKPNTKGSGIGLTIAKAWVEAHGGKIWAESEGGGKGTKISFTLPV